MFFVKHWVLFIVDTEKNFISWVSLNIFSTHLLSLFPVTCVMKNTPHNQRAKEFAVLKASSVLTCLFPDPPAVEPAFLEIRQGQERSVTMSCRVLRAYPIRVLTYEWRLGNKLLRSGQFDSQEYTEYPLKSLSNENYGVYNCSIINEAGAGRCSFLVTGRTLNYFVLKNVWHKSNGS